MTRPVSELPAALAEERGAVVSSADCSEMEIAFARTEGRFFVDDDGLGYVLRTRTWLLFTAGTLGQHCKASDAEMGYCARTP